jgi:hypothetical protein
LHDKEAFYFIFQKLFFWTQAEPHLNLVDNILWSHDVLEKIVYANKQPPWQNIEKLTTPANSLNSYLSQTKQNPSVVLSYYIFIAYKTYS